MASGIGIAEAGFEAAIMTGAVKTKADLINERFDIASLPSAVYPMTRRWRVGVPWAAAWRRSAEFALKKINAGLHLASRAAALCQAFTRYDRLMPMLVRNRKILAG